MGLFDFFKKKEAANRTAELRQEEKLDMNSFLIETLRKRLGELGYDAVKNPAYAALTVVNKLEIATAVVENPNNHPNIIHLMVATIHPDYFPDGIIENIVGAGLTPEGKVETVLDNYLNTTFEPIIESFSDSHNPDLDFNTILGDNEILWHPKLGNIFYQGNWDNHLIEGEPLYSLLKSEIGYKLSNQKFNWLKIYVARQANGDITGECLLNNEPWEEGLNKIREYADAWPNSGEFLGMKQFIMFRRCDVND